MSSIPGGTFELSEEDEAGARLLRYRTTVDPFCLDVTEVTVSAYDSCVKAGACTKPDDRTRFCNFGDDARRNHPINCVDWFQAQAYCAWAGKRLPTNAEWEIAARGGTEYRIYPWGDDAPDATRACYGRYDGTCVAGSHPPEAFGLRDMGGNVGEWVFDWMAPYPRESVRYRGPETGRFRTIRGAAWGSGEKFLPAHIRRWLPPKASQAGNGIRCALKANEPRPKAPR